MRNSTYIFYEHTARSAELDEEIEERDSPMPLKINNKAHRQTGLYYYGARYYNPRTSVWLSVDPIALWQPVQEVEHYIEGQHNGGYFNPKNMSVYGYTYQNPLRYIDPNGKQVDVVVEAGNIFKGNVGHTFVSLGTGKDQIVYTYGRWAGTTGFIRTPLNNGPGVMVKLQGDDAKKEVEKYKRDGANIFRISKANEEKVKAYLEAQYNKSSKTPEKGSYKGDERAHVIDEYDIWSNNCTTKTLDAVKEGMSGRDISYTYPIEMVGSDYTGTITVSETTNGTISPSRLNGQLTQATKDPHSGVTKQKE